MSIFNVFSDRALHGFCNSQDNTCIAVNTVCQNSICVCERGYKEIDKSCIQIGTYLKQFLFLFSVKCCICNYLFYDYFLS